VLQAKMIALKDAGYKAADGTILDQDVDFDD
jgi:hypothetical protein